MTNSDGPVDGTSRVGKISSGGASPWKSARPEVRDAIVALVADTLESLQQDPASWLPAAIDRMPDGGFSLTIEWDIDKVETAVAVRRRLAQAKERAMIADLQRLAGGADGSS